VFEQGGSSWKFMMIDLSLSSDEENFIAGSLSEISSRRPCLPMFEQGGSSGKVMMIDLSLSSDEENFIADISREVEFANKLFGDLNRDILGPPSDGKVIILDNPDEEKEAQEEKMADTEPTATSAAVNLASTASVDANDAPVGTRNNNSDDQRPDQEADSGNGNRGDADEP
jgi:hypothetical protein